MRKELQGLYLSFFTNTQIDKYGYSQGREQKTQLEVEK